MAEWWLWEDAPREFRARIISISHCEPHTVLYTKHGEPWPKELLGPRKGSTLMCELSGGYNLFALGENDGDCE